MDAARRMRCGDRRRGGPAEERRILLIEPSDAINTGDAGGELTDTEAEWI